MRRAVVKGGTTLRNAEYRRRTKDSTLEQRALSRKKKLRRETKSSTFEEGILGCFAEACPSSSFRGSLGEEEKARWETFFDSRSSQSPRRVQDTFRLIKGSNSLMCTLALLIFLLATD
ncbi:hypothetical protein KM043_003644 [Ampulex compressa]|nr:hypothetical protein KM043_003644 [Ampulex compressa]